MPLELDCPTIKMQDSIVCLPCCKTKSPHFGFGPQTPFMPLLLNYWPRVMSSSIEKEETPYPAII